MATVNEFLRDEAIAHAVALHQYSNHVVQRIVGVLNRSDARLFAELIDALSRLSPDSFTVQRLEDLLFDVRKLNKQAYDKLTKELTDELSDFTVYEAGYQRQLMLAAFPVVVLIAAVVPEAVYTAALARPFQGVILRGALKDLESGRAKLIRQTIAQGFVESKTTDAIVRELRGTQANGYADGLLQRPRREIEAVTRTALGHMAGFTRDRFFEANGDLIKAIKWTSTLDTRTSQICRVRDGKLYHPVTHRPMGHDLPWLGGAGSAHWNCRSTAVAVTKSWRELGIDLPDFKSDTRASMDGQVPADLTYEQWIKKQSAERQDEILGPTRGKLMRDGGADLGDFYGAKGRYLTLAELRARDAEMFKRAGL